MNPQFESEPVKKGVKVVLQSEHKVNPTGLDEAIAEILKPGSDNRVFVQCTAYLKKFNLQDKYDAAFVVNEAYLRARETPGSTKISDYFGWVRATSYNIVRELSRAEKKTRDRSSGLDINSISADDDLNWADDDLETIEQRHMRQAFATLSPLEQAILKFKVVEGRRWGEIQSNLIAAGFPEISLNLLSQTKRRALRKLKKTYLSIAA
jgi:DNA-directed RNA polymerase specialized sigma24 family protein